VRGTIHKQAVDIRGKDSRASKLCDVRISPPEMLMTAQSSTMNTEELKRRLEQILAPEELHHSDQSELARWV
jgi:hypothetical protein